MSGKGNGYDNAVAESFFHTLKVEAVHGERFATREAMRRAVFEYIEVDYNRTRRHGANGYISLLGLRNQNDCLTMCPSLAGKIKNKSERLLTIRFGENKTHHLN